MIEEIATVQSVHDDWASVVTTQRPSCHNCHEVNSCSTSTLSKFFGAKQIELNIHSKLPLKQGDQVVVGMKEAVFLVLTGLIYFLPLCVLFLFAIFGQYVGSAMNVESELLSIAFALSGFVGCYYLVKNLIQQFFDPKKFHPVILKKV